MGRKRTLRISQRIIPSTLIFPIAPRLRLASKARRFAIPTIFFAIYFQRAFITALELSGGIGDSFISGLIPAMMIWKGRYSLAKQGSYKVNGGKPVLVLIGFFSILILSCEILRRIFV